MNELLSSLNSEERELLIEFLIEFKKLCREELFLCKWELEKKDSELSSGLARYLIDEAQNNHDWAKNAACSIPLTGKIWFEYDNAVIENHVSKALKHSSVLYYNMNYIMKIISQIKVKLNLY